MRHYSAAFPSPVAAFLFTFLQCLYSCYYVLYGKSEVWEQFAVRSRCTKTIHSDDVTVKSDITIPSKSRKCLYCNSLSYILWKTFALYSSDCSSKISIHGMDTTRTSIPSSAKTFFASTARDSSEPEAIIIASGTAFLESCTI